MTVYIERAVLCQAVIRTPLGNRAQAMAAENNLGISAMSKLSAAFSSAPSVQSEFGYGPFLPVLLGS
jgi:hypothetical protein